MAEWNVQPTWKKSVIERNYLTKDGNTVCVETGWRWGEFIVYTDDDNPPKIESGVDIYNCDYETELVETFDGCWEDVDYDDCDDETREWLEEFFEENSWLDLEEHGWMQDECEMIIDCDLVIRKVNEDGSLSDPIETGDSEDSEDTEEIVDDIQSMQAEIKAGAKWPFEHATEPEEKEYAQFKCESCDFTTEDIMDLEESDDESKGAYVCPECGGKVDLG